MKGSELAELSLAVLAHDPPWKPWGIKAGGIDGCGQEPYWACIAGKLKEFYKGDDRVVRALEEAVKLYRELEKRVESHELQGALILRTLAARLESRGFKELAEATRRAEERILDPRVREADRLASAIDRVFLSRELSEAHPVFINPVNPYLVQPYREKLGVSLVARYVKELVEHVLMLLGESRRATIGDPMLLAHLVYSFLEPLWYKVISESGLEPQKYVPPADTRIPTHTVFDHLNAALAALLWTVGGGPSGCMAIVDLAGVQSWISEARRLRDLWAASWIASMLAWKTIEGLVEEYGPGVLVQPPARLNAFYASWLLGRKLGSDPAGRNLKETLDMLGLRLGWPLDPTMPCRAHLALPKEECSGLEDRIKDYYERAWKLFAEKLCEWASKVCSEIEETIEGGGEDSRVSKVCKRLDSLGLCNLDPPLPLRIVIVDVERAWREARSL
ncbi:MAG: hypothetical protein LRS43_00415, partial [Desulfurococcales archaeon]|nr:hypothetical protein [Desulfurococcales archaeon]